ncbi:hypothetical protein DNU06_05195 [Putridiphycobacter roseus]|uniref:Uncharacterized protein n=1 Tax=Putridiphycobacter roseus TaxID=2219161 RepID=A0A2W1N2E6_9FLAO|nr:hypothetical protein [Putridiphycobacter roseus]PZE18014.1 hypothetical protein DNU06_05195 [Putridiphycobacter roseus]
MIDCKKAALLVEKKKYVKLPFFSVFGLKFHMSICKDCRHYENDSKAIDHLIKMVYDNSAKLSEEEKQKMIEKLQER